MRSNVFVFLGPPGSGKGTQAERLCSKMNLPHISLGDILRKEVREESEIGKQIKDILSAGNLVPDEITIGLTKVRVVMEDCRAGFVLDGFPRSAPQAEAFDEMPVVLDKVIYFDLTEEEVVKRLSGRRSCKSCGAVYHVAFKAPKAAGICDRCGAELYQRSDDVEAAIKNRFNVYGQQTMPLINHYEQLNKLVRIDANGSMDEVFTRLEAVVNGQ
ncbi:adenylate kinase [candidate division WOR-1 bacterium RIFOXYB2_FULL_42_35]|uniref:Adenylate kinase n=1 Tax=candidate division WOR-1 bacterium RIFOXYC2_FULL_41_25 TaxID=1802586 RepID=A0A1F4TM05_UNCSA|nr:MAG: adenylate kinase [candidate division WOR-1 bacterium RIFOXYA2_FULL_41_14]OGC23873.1 MAG: adenylate kinase [candidate division WOR-1 bacterium RIFOXYB2_FULL_42_35]OGC33748.1 MAG: adenylate kinase [candidate division WOR-1 bacterium RIFOXYC2_FULL_41_25]OGC42498.1 MAG: adenylate kinase [candidate division WOR-1 bacterium RIFOXYD2_FULL_41_8]